MEVLRTARLGFNFTGSYKKVCSFLMNHYNCSRSSNLYLQLVETYIVVSCVKHAWTNKNQFTNM